MNQEDANEMIARGDAAMGRNPWRSIDSAPKDIQHFILLYCPEDNSRWLARWQGGEWYGVDDLGLTRTGYSAGDPNVVTGWAITHWAPLPMPPSLKSPQGIQK